MKMQQKLAGICACAIALSSLTVPLAQAVEFKDTNAHWAKNSITRWADYGVVNGFGNHQFKPEDTVTRAQMAQMLANTLGLTAIPTENPFTDVSDSDWFQEAILKCNAAGIMNGTSVITANPNAEISRQDAVTMMGRALGIEADGTATDFEDNGNIGSWAAGYVNAMAKRKIVNGRQKGIFAPTGQIKRGEIATILDRAITTYVNTPNTEVTASTTGITLIAAPDVTIKGEALDILIAPAATETTKLDSVKVSGAVTMQAVNGSLILGGSTTVAKLNVPALTTGAKMTIEKDATVTAMNSAADNVAVDGTGAITDMIVSGGKNVAVAGSVKVSKITNNGSEAMKHGDTTIAANTSSNAVTTTTNTSGGGFSGGSNSSSSSSSSSSTVYYTVSFNTDGGSAVSTQRITSGATVSQPTAPTKSGYTFSGWYMDSACTNAFDFSTAITADITLYAKWTPINATYTVTLDAVGGALQAINGSIEASQTVKSGELAKRPADPERDGYRFTGWYSDSSYTEKFYFATPITEDTTLYAKWVSIERYPRYPEPGANTITFDTQGGYDTFSQTVYDGETVPEPPAPTKDGHVFMYWGHGWLFDFNKPIRDEGSVGTIRAQWSDSDAEQFYVAFKNKDGSEVAYGTVTVNNSNRYNVIDGIDYGGKAEFKLGGDNPDFKVYSIECRDSAGNEVAWTENDGVYSIENITSNIEVTLDVTQFVDIDFIVPTGVTVTIDGIDKTIVGDDSSRNFVFEVPELTRAKGNFETITFTVDSGGQILKPAKVNVYTNGSNYEIPITEENGVYTIAKDDLNSIVDGHALQVDIEPIDVVAVSLEDEPSFTVNAETIIHKNELDGAEYTVTLTADDVTQIPAYKLTVEDPNNDETKQAKHWVGVGIRRTGWVNYSRLFLRSLFISTESFEDALQTPRTESTAFYDVNTINGKCYGMTYLDLDQLAQAGTDGKIYLVAGWYTNWFNGKGEFDRILVDASDLLNKLDNAPTPPQEAEIIASGDCSYTENDNVTWELDSKGVLSISGTGMIDNMWDDSCPWVSYRNSIKRVVIETGVTHIGMHAFKDCTNLTSVEISNSVTEIYSSTFENCTSLTSIVIPNDVTFIAGGMFQNCTNLANVAIPEKVTEILSFAFKNCTSLTNITIPNSVTEIGMEAFQNCSNLTDVYYTGSEEDWKAIKIWDENEALTNATIHYNSTGAQSLNTNSDFIEPEITPSTTEPSPQDTVNLIETNDEIPEEVPQEEDNSAQEQDSGLIEESQPEEIPPVEVPAA